MSYIDYIYLKRQKKNEWHKDSAIYSYGEENSF